MDTRRRDEQAQAMYDLYLQGHSLSQVAKAFGRTRQSVYGLLSVRGWKLRGKLAPLPYVVFDGRKYTVTTNGYYRATEGDRSHLHRDIWIKANGPIPDGWDVHHIDEDKGNNRLSNFECLPKGDHTRHHNPQQVVEDQYCLFCGTLLVRRMSPSGATECPSMFLKRKHCNLQCSGKHKRGLPKGTRSERS